MGKNKNKDKEEIPNPTSVANRDILQRLNFLYQASVLLNGLAPPDSTHRGDDPSRSSMTLNDQRTDTEIGYSSSCPQKPQKKRRRRMVSFGELSRSYVETMKSVGQKTNVRMDPSVKRRICKRCSAPLVPGISATVRIKDSASHGHLISYQCHACQTERRIPAPPVLGMESKASTDGGAMETPGSVSVVTTDTANTVRPGKQKRQKGPKPRLPPHFARDVGHVVFRGTELLDATGIHSIS